ncbi:MAG: YncE family protein, partial [Actinobacteria bacterium]
MMDPTTPGTSSPGRRTRHDGSEPTVFSPSASQASPTTASHPSGAVRRAVRWTRQAMISRSYGVGTASSCPCGLPARDPNLHRIGTDPDSDFGPHLGTIRTMTPKHRPPRSRGSFVAVLVGLLLVSGGAIAAAALDPPDHPSVSPVSSAASSRSATSAPSPSQTAPPQAPSTPVATGARAATRGPVNVYAAPASGVFSRAVAGIPQRVYVPNVSSGTISVIDPKTYQVIKTLQVGGRAHHITPSWDLKHLYIDNPGSGSLREIDPRTAALGPTIAARTPYNLYFTPDGTKAIVVAEYAQQLVFRDRRTWRVLKVVPIPGRGVDHMDFSANGRYLLVSCEYTGVVARVS